VLLRRELYCGVARARVAHLPAVGRVYLNVPMVTTPDPSSADLLSPPSLQVNTDRNIAAAANNEFLFRPTLLPFMLRLLLVISYLRKLGSTHTSLQFCAYSAIAVSN
jgi:hypothetical protein